MRGAWVEGLHRTHAGHIVGAGAVVPALRDGREDRALVIGTGTVVQGAIQHAGGVSLAARATVWDRVDGGHEVVLGARVVVRGPVAARGRVVVQAGATVHGDVTAGGDVLLLGDCTVGDVNAGGDVVIVGTPRTGRILPGGRVQTRAW